MKFNYLFLTMLMASGVAHSSITKEEVILPYASIHALKASFSVHDIDRIKQKLKLKPAIVHSEFAEAGANKADVGMNGVPVLNQGMHATPTTFALIAAIDALRGSGDFYSPLCMIALGHYLSEKGFGASGWQGAETRVIVGRIQEFGLVPMSKQKLSGCGGLIEYPNNSNAIVSPMHPEQYHRLSESLKEARFHELQLLYDANDRYFQELPFEQVFVQMQKALKKGQRLILRFYSPIDEQNGIHGKYKANIDTWVFSDAIQENLEAQPDFLERFYAHELIITGFDDNAMVIDDTGKRHMGLIKLRNSWGDTLGDHGDFYMTYDYLSILADSIFSIK